MTFLEYPVCDCAEPKVFNDSPDACELNKFDDMIRLAASASPSFRQVVAVDQSFELFERAWCVAELVQAQVVEIERDVKILSTRALDQHYLRLLGIDVRQCQASRPEDAAEILRKIGSDAAIEQFNTDLKDTIFGQGGLFAKWMDGVDKGQHAGRLAKRALARQTAARQERQVELTCLPELTLRELKSATSLRWQERQARQAELTSLRPEAEAQPRAAAEIRSAMLRMPQGLVASPDEGEDDSPARRPLLTGP